MKLAQASLALAAAALLASPAASLAADLPSRKAAPPVVLAPPPVFTWAGLYAGLNLGYGRSTSVSPVHSVRVENGVPTPLAEINYLPGPVPSGVIGGAQVGYNWQFGRMVLGLETDFQGATLEGVSHGTGPIIPGHNFALPGQSTHGVDWFGTARARVGYTLFDPRFMLFATGGFAVGGVHYSQLFVDSDFDIGNLSARRVQTGWTVGGGAEWAFSDRWSAKVEYLYTDLGHSPNLDVTEITPGTFVQPDVHKTFNTNGTRFHTIRAGLNYRFDLFGAPTPIAARY